MLEAFDPASKASAKTFVTSLELSDAAVCTSGDYERRASAGHHIVDARTHRAVSELASVTVIAPTAMAADGLSTAAMVLGRKRGLEFLEAQAVGAVLMAPDGATWEVNL